MDGSPFKVRKAAVERAAVDRAGVQDMETDRKERTLRTFGGEGRSTTERAGRATGVTVRRRVTCRLVPSVSRAGRPDDLGGAPALHDVPVLPQAPQPAGAGGAPDAPLRHRPPRPHQGPHPSQPAAPGRD